MSSTERSRVFIGSSTEGLEVAEQIQINLDYTCECTIWSQGVFGLGQGSLESLVDSLSNYDFAILVLTNDDLTTSRGTVLESPRDNVLFELGLFMGHLGRERTFIVYDRNKAPKLPSDLAGVTAATFQMHSDGNLHSSLGAPTTLIKKSISRLGIKKNTISGAPDQLAQFHILNGLLEASVKQFIIWMFEADSTITRINELYHRGISYTFIMENQSGGMGTFSIDTLCKKLPDSGLLQIDLRNNVSLTDRGREFGQYLISNGQKAVYFKSPLATWGEVPPNMPDGMFFRRSSDDES